MIWRTTRRTFIGLFTTIVAIAALAGGLVFAQIQSPVLLVLTAAVQSCGEGKGASDVAAAAQGSEFGLAAQGFFANEPLLLSITFADGRTYSLNAAQSTLNATNQQVDDGGFVTMTTAGGDFSGYFSSNNNWPVGCHTFTAFGVNSQLEAKGTIAILSRGADTLNSGATNLTAISLRGNQPKGVQGVAINLLGRGYLAQEQLTLLLIQPDGTIETLDSPTTSTVGSFQVSITLGTNRQVGEYTFVAISTTGLGSVAPFELQAATINRTGFSQVRIADPVNGSVAQGGSFQLIGRDFRPGESVIVTLIQPNGVQRELTTTQSNYVGELAVTLSTDRQTPTGRQTLLVTSAASVITLPLMIAPGSVVIPPAAVTNPAAALNITAPGGQPPADMPDGTNVLTGTTVLTGTSVTTTTTALPSPVTTITNTAPQTFPSTLPDTGSSAPPLPQPQIIILPTSVPATTDSAPAPAAPPGLPLPEF